MNVELLLAIADMIEAEPKHWDLSDFLRVDWHATSWREKQSLTANEFYVRCDTAACVAGWATILASEPEDKIGSLDFLALGRRALEITAAEANRLFYASRHSVWTDVADEYGWDRITLIDGEDWSIIKAEQAADVLRRIARGELTL